MPVHKRHIGKSVTIAIVIHAIVILMLVLGIQIRDNHKSAPGVDTIQAKIIEAPRLAENHARDPEPESSAPELEAQKHKQLEEEQKRMLAEKQRLQERRKEEEQKQRQADLEQQEQKKLLAKQKQIEEEQRKLADLKKQEEQKKLLAEQKRQEELKKQEEQKKLLAEQKRQEELKKQEEQKKLLAEQKRQEELKKQEEQKKLLAEQELEAEQKRKLEEQRKLAEEKRRQDAENKRLAELKKIEDARKRAEAERRAEQERLAKVLAEEEALLRAEQASRRATQLQSLRQQYMSAIATRVQQQWRRPIGGDDVGSCVVNVTQTPGGYIQNVQVTACTAGETFRRSVEAAVLKAEPLPEPPDPEIFDRDIRFNFNPNG